MKRRSLLVSAGCGLTAGLSGCVGSRVVQEIKDIIRLKPLSGRVWRINEIGGSAEIRYTVKSEDYTFQVFYFTNRADADTYEAALAGQDVTGEPIGQTDLMMTAVPNANGVYMAERPPEGGRYKLDIEQNHFIAIDYSNYAQNLRVDEYDDDLQVSIDVEVVETGVF